MEMRELVTHSGSLYITPGARGSVSRCVRERCSLVVQPGVQDFCPHPLEIRGRGMQMANCCRDSWCLLVFPMCCGHWEGLLAPPQSQTEGRRNADHGIKTPPGTCCTRSANEHPPKADMDDKTRVPTLGVRPKHA
eukprot:470983-Prymnesium_polylepis.3